jgi:hypothetical protein
MNPRMRVANQRVLLKRAAAVGHEFFSTSMLEAAQASLPRKENVRDAIDAAGKQGNRHGY